MDQPGPSGKQKAKNRRKNAGKSRGRKSVCEHVSKGVIKRLARRGGVKRMSALIYNETRAMLKEFLKSLLKDACLYCEYSRRKTVTAADVVLAMKTRGHRLYGFDDPPFPFPIRSSIRLTSDTPSTANTQSTISSAAENTDDQSNGNLFDSDSTEEDLDLRRCTRSTSHTTGENVETEIMRRSSRNLRASRGSIESMPGRNAENLNNSNFALGNSDFGNESDNSESLIKDDGRVDDIYEFGLLP